MNPRHHRAVKWLISHQCLKRSPNVVGVELGVYRGDLSAAILSTFPTLHLHLVDKWTQVDKNSDYYKTGDGAAKHSQDEHLNNKLRTLEQIEPFKERATIWHCSGVEAAREMLSKLDKEFLDFIFIDAEHTKKAVIEDIMTWWPLIKRGGIISGHDYCPNRWPEIKEAIDEFVQRSNLSLNLGRGTVWWFIKPS